MTQAVWSMQFFPGGQNGGKEELSGKLCLFGGGGGVGAFLSFWGVDLASLVMGGLTLNPCIDHTGHKSGL